MIINACHIIKIIKIYLYNFKYIFIYILKMVNSKNIKKSKKTNKELNVLKFFLSFLILFLFIAGIAGLSLKSYVVGASLLIGSIFLLLLFIKYNILTLYNVFQTLFILFFINKF